MNEAADMEAHLQRLAWTDIMLDLYISKVVQHQDFPGISFSWRASYSIPRVKGRPRPATSTKSEDMSATC